MTLEHFGIDPSRVERERSAAVPLSGDSAYALALVLRTLPVVVEREYRFHPDRRWRFDFAVPAIRLALEAEGGNWSAGRHVRGRGFASDCEKYAEAAILGWTVLRFTTEQIEDGYARDAIVRWLERA
jgi:very-short-patch-repair endonuclease